MTTPPYIELHSHSHYSLLDGSSSPSALVQRAATLGMPALALTDHDALYGAVEFAHAAEEGGVRPILGAELSLNGGGHLTLLVTNERGWANLCWLITQGQATAPKGLAALPDRALYGRTEGLIALSGCGRGRIMQALQQGEYETALAAGEALVDLFGPDRTWIELQHHLRSVDGHLVARGVSLAEALGIGYVATNNVHYANRDGHRLQDVMVAIRHNQTLEAATSHLRPNSEFHLKSASQMAELFTAYPAALQNTQHIAAQCTFSLPTGLQALPEVPLPKGLTADVYLDHLCQRALIERYGSPATRLTRQVAHELGIIQRAGLSNYFLIVHDVVRFARSQGIRCQGRGSACNSLVAYLLGISPINPLEHDLLFERFLSDEQRGRVPDIDLDLQADRREEVIQYLYQCYGADHVAMACTISTFRARSALRDTAKALGIPEALVDPIVKLLDGRGGDALNSSPELSALADRGAGWQQLRELAQALIGSPRHLGLHNGGMVITREPLAQRIAIEPAAMEGRTVTQWDKESLETAGVIKIDLLGLRMLSVLAEAQSWVAQETGRPLDLDHLPLDDPAIYDLLCEADTVGLFQVESRAQAQVLPRLQPRTFSDIVIAISLIRPGPLQGQMVHPFLRRRLGEEPVTYEHALLEGALSETLGVVLFQEQVLKVARGLAGFSAGQGEQLRRALGKKHAHTALELFCLQFLQGAQKRGVSAEVAHEVWEQLKSFGGYAFAKSHAAAFAVIVYQSAYLKVYHPASFFCALLNQQPMGFWSPSVLVNDAKRHGIGVLPVDVQRSAGRCTMRGRQIRLGLEYIKGLGEAASGQIIRARAGRHFDDLWDFCRRTRLHKQLVERLIMAGALDGWQIKRRQLLWELGTLNYVEEALPIPIPDTGAQLPTLTEFETALWEQSVTGLSVGPHLLTHYRESLRARGVLGSAELAASPSGRRVQVAGLKIMHQAPPTARGIHFITLEDEEGMLNIVVRPEVYTTHRTLLRQAALLHIEGIVQRRDGVVNVVAHLVKSWDYPAD